MSTPALLLLLLHTVRSACNSSGWLTTRCSSSTCYIQFNPALQALYLTHPRRSYFTRGVSFYSEDKQLLLSLYIRMDATAADVKCIGEERNALTEQQFPYSSKTLEYGDSKEWTIRLLNDTVLIQEDQQQATTLIQTPGQALAPGAPVQGTQLAWNIHKLGCYNIIKAVRYVEFVHMHDGAMCLGEVARSTHKEGLQEEEEEERKNVRDVHLITNILIVMAVSCFVILMCIVALCKQCRLCVSRMCCLHCSRTSYNVSKMEQKVSRGRYNVEELVMTDTDSERSNIVSLLQY